MGVPGRMVAVGVLSLQAMGALIANAQVAGGWVVQPEWVRAHEEFLASDALEGRGSATRDEEISATYVASEFLSYGLTTAPGMKGYLQAAAILAPTLDGHARLTAGAVTVEQGQGLELLSTAGVTLAGPLVKVDLQAGPAPGVAPGAVLLVSGTGDASATGRMMRAARQIHARAVLVAESPATRKMLAASAGETTVRRHLAEDNAPGAVTLASLNAGAMTRMEGLKEGETVSLAIHAIPGPSRATYNAIGYLPGSDPAAGTLLLTAHLDHLGVGKPVHGDAIYNGANDDASGTTAVMELAHALASGPKLRRSVLFVCYGSEEAGELGSEYFGRHSPVALKDLVANLEFEMIGTQDPKMPKNTLLLTGWERSNLGPELKKHGALLGPDPYPEQHFFERSDNYQLALDGVVAHTAAGYGTPATYHQPDDDLAHLDLPFLTAAIQSLVEPVRWLANSDFKPAWNAGGQPKR